MQAIYARQSVEKADSISIEMQIELCRQLCRTDSEPVIYTDRGFSGTNVQRPGFQAMLCAIQQGDIGEVYVYKLDRISRSLCDFAGMMRLFRQKGVTLYSVQERFDTQTEMGGLLLHLLMMFAEMEQKTIAGRMRDNYYARARQQLPLGGIAPYGYQPMAFPQTGLQLWKEEADRVVWMYTGYGVAGQSVEQLVHQANQRGWRTRSNHFWSNASVLRILRSPFYVRGCLGTVRHLQAQGAKLTHELNRYCQGNGYLTYGNPQRRKGTKYVRWDGEQVAAGTHPGLIEGSLWLSVQERLAQRSGACNRGSGQTSWLQGLVTCGICGTPCYARNNGRGAAYTYFVCRGKRLGICPGIGGVQAGRVESYVANVLKQQAEPLLAQTAISNETIDAPEAVALAEVAEKMQRLVAELAAAQTAKPVLRQALESLAAEKQALETALRLREATETKKAVPWDWDGWWESAPLLAKRRAAGLLLETIRIFPTRLEICLR